jgi:hypothetical protein
MKITILQRPGHHASRDFSSSLESTLHFLKGELGASFKLDGFSQKGWARIDIQGEDSEVARQLVIRNLGQAQTDLLDVEAQGVYEGIISSGLNDKLEVDIGIESPTPVNVKIELEALRAQLADGKPLRINEIIREYCLIPGSRAAVRITRLEQGKHSVGGWLADSQIERLAGWIGTRLDRIQISDSYRREVEYAIRKANLERDIVSVEPITLTAQSVVCKLGTDAVGLISKLGSVLRERELNPFIPKRIINRCRPW